KRRSFLPGDKGLGFEDRGSALRPTRMGDRAVPLTAGNQCERLPRGNGRHRHGEKQESGSQPGASGHRTYPWNARAEAEVRVAEDTVGEFPLAVDRGNLG